MDAGDSPEIPVWKALGRSLLPLAVGLAFALAMHLAFLPLFGPFYAKLALDIGIAIILAVSLNIVNGFTGQFSIGHAAFMAAGGYLAAAITYYGSMMIWGQSIARGGILSYTQSISTYSEPLFAWGDLLFVAACLAGGLFGALWGYFVGLPSLRLRGDYLAIVTLGFGEIVRVLIQQTEPVLYQQSVIHETPIPELAFHVGGAVGFNGVPYYTSLFWVYSAVAVTLIVSCRLKLSSYGRAFLSIREDEIAAEAMGVRTTRYKVRAFVVAAFFAGVAGGLFAHQVGNILNPRELGFMKSFEFVIMVVLGGMGSISGAVLAAAFLTVLPELLRNPPHIWHVGLIVIALAALYTRRNRLRTIVSLVGLIVGLEVIRAAALAYGVELSEYRMVLYALTLILMMILRPQGLFGVHEIWELDLLGPWRGLLSRVRPGSGRQQRSSDLASKGERP